MSNTGKFKDTTPHLRAAGLHNLSGDTAGTRECIEPDDQPGMRVPTPDNIKKFRRSHAPKAGEKRILHSFADDPPLPDIVHGVGTRTKVGHSASNVLNPAEESPVQKVLKRQKESLYRSFPPLGHNPHQGRFLPPLTQEPDYRFGIACDINESAKELICPPEDDKETLEATEKARALYVRSHGNYGPGEQRNRNYTWTKNLPRDTMFGVQTVHANDGREVAESLRWTQETQRETTTKIINKKVEDFRKKTIPELGRVHDPIADTMRVGPDHAHGISLPADEYNAGDLIARKGLPLEYDEYLGKSVPTHHIDVPKDHVFGVPTIRSDITAPKFRSVADHQNYGDESDARGLVNPSIFSNVGIYEQDVLCGRDATEIRDIFKSIGVEFTDEAFNDLYKVAASWDPQGLVSVDAFHRAVISSNVH